MTKYIRTEIGAVIVVPEKKGTQSSYYCLPCAKGRKRGIDVVVVEGVNHNVLKLKDEGEFAKHVHTKKNNTPTNPFADLSDFDLELVTDITGEREKDSRVVFYVRTIEDRPVGIFGETISPDFYRLEEAEFWWKTIKEIFIQEVSK